MCNDFHPTLLVFFPKKVEVNILFLPSPIYAQIPFCTKNSFCFGLFSKVEKKASSQAHLCSIISLFLSLFWSPGPEINDDNKPDFCPLTTKQDLANPLPLFCSKFNICSNFQQPLGFHNWSQTSKKQTKTFFLFFT